MWMVHGPNGALGPFVALHVMVVPDSGRDSVSDNKTTGAIVMESVTRIQSVVQEFVMEVSRYSVVLQNHFKPSSVQIVLLSNYDKTILKFMMIGLFAYVNEQTTITI